MDGFFTPRRSFLEGLIFGLLAAAACYLPPLHAAARLDGLLYDLWSRSISPDPPSDIILVELEDPAWLSSLADLARHQDAKLLITTLPQPPSPLVNASAIGPVDLPIGETRLRRTEWSRGGHLWFRPELDGVVRRDWPLLEDDAPIPSLPLYAAAALDRMELPATGAGGDQSAARLVVDRLGWRWLRFYPRHGFEHVRPADLLADPELIANRIVIAGLDAPRYATPVGQLTAHELVAQMLAGYRQREAIDAGPLGAALAWTATLALLTLLALKPARGGIARWLLPAGGTAGLILWSGISFALGSVWLPVAAPAVLLLVTGGADALRATRAARGGAIESVPSELVNARRLAAGGELEAAWALYRQIPAATALLNELYELGRVFEQQNQNDYAADVFHRVAHVDAHFRDVARRLVKSNHPADQNAATTERAGPERDSMPEHLGRYELLEPIGRGAMGHVYLGRDPKINRIVAIKAVDFAAEFEPTELGAASRRFLREAETAGRLSHPNIVTIYDVGEAGGLAYIAMEYLKGRHLSEFAQPDTLLPLPIVLDLLSRTAEALDYAHSQNVVHRDIKPGNIMYDPISDSLKITDFGIARLIDVSRTRTGIVLGTPAFMSPEQLEGKNVNGHTDLFALGVSLYQLLTGHLPFRGASMTTLMFVIANEPHQSVTAVRTDLPGYLNPIVDRALAKDPADRFPTGAEMAAALRHGAAQLG